RLTIGYLDGNEAVELSGYYISPQARRLVSLQPGRLLVPFNTPAQGVPLGFEGDNGLWLNADRVQSFYSNQIGNVEANYRLWNAALINTELILGIRYFSLQEQAGIFTTDDLFLVDFFGRSDPRRAALYTATARNTMLTAQFGGEYSWPCTIPHFGWLWYTG